MQYSQKKHVCWSLFLIKLQSIRPATLLKRGSNIGVFLWLLQNFWEQQFRRTSERCSVIKRNRWNVIINFHVFMRKMYYKYAQSNSYRTARKTIFSFSKRFENMVFPKKIALEYISCIIRKDDISFSRKYDLILDTKWKMIFLKKKKKTGNMIFSSDVLERWSFQEICAWTQYLFFPENMIFLLWAENERRWFYHKTRGNMVFSVYIRRRYKHDIPPPPAKRQRCPCPEKIHLRMISPASPK